MRHDTGFYRPPHRSGSATAFDQARGIPEPPGIPDTTSCASDHPAGPALAPFTNDRPSAFERAACWIERNGNAIGLVVLAILGVAYVVLVALGWVVVPK